MIVINLFTISKNDQSIYFLSQIFGNVGTVLPDTSNAMLLGQMFRVFNTVALVIGIFVIIYTTIVGLMLTAHHGKFLGEKWSGLWVPVRTLIGIAALFPTASGYSALQIIVMWIIVQGVGAADTLWNTVLNFVQVSGSPMKSLTREGDALNLLTPDKLEGLLTGLICQATAHESEPIRILGQTNNFYYCQDNSQTPFCKNPINLRLDINKTEYQMGPDGTCGTLTYCDRKKICDGSPNSRIACAACQAQQNVLQDIISEFGNIAENVTRVDKEYAQFYTGMHPAAPQWMERYCQDQGILSSTCCKIKENIDPQSGCTIQLNFPSVIDNFLNPKPMQNATALAVGTVYLPYGLSTLYSDPSFLKKANDSYISTITNAITREMTATSSSEELQGCLKTSQETGWMYAGAYYYCLVKERNNASQASNPELKVTPPNVTRSAIENYRNQAMSSTYFIKFIKQLNEKKEEQQRHDVDINVNINVNVSDLQDMSDKLSWFNRTIADFYLNTLMGGDGDSFLEVVSFGHTVMSVAIVCFIAILGILFIAATIGGSSFLGTGVGLGHAITSVASFIGPLAGISLAGLVSFGALLGIYIPLIPYILFSMAAIGWLIFVIEAMIAAPLVGLGLLAPGGEGLFGHAERSLMLLLNVMLRPSLMIFGMLTAMLIVSKVGIPFVNKTFVGLMGFVSGIKGVSIGPVALLFFMAAYTFLVIGIINKCFSLIHVIPERIITWLGGHSQAEDTGLNDIKHGMDSYTSTVGRGMQKRAQKSHKAAGEKLSKSDDMLMG